MYIWFGSQVGADTNISAELAMAQQPFSYRGICVYGIAMRAKGEKKKHLNCSGSGQNKAFPCTPGRLDS
jgi:hypothetical protein